jgi:hypothetical protein
MNLFTKAVLFTAATTWSSVSLAGLVSGGGGGTMPSQPVSQDDILTAIQQARPLVEVHLMAIEAFRLGGNETHTADRKLFSRGDYIYKILDKVKVETPLYQPCYDLDGNPQDGSVKAGDPSTICISVANLKEKLNADNFETETAALILHEITHLLETSEDEADYIQSEFLAALRGVSFKSLQDWIDANAEAVYGTARNIESAVISLEQGTLKCHQFTPIKRDFIYADQLGWDFRRMRVMSRNSLGYLWNRIVELESVSDFLCSLPTIGNSQENEFHGRKYSLGFGNQSRVTANEYLHRSTGKNPLPPQNSDLWLEKLSTAEAATAELRALDTVLSRLQNDYEMMSMRQFELVQ